MTEQEVVLQGHLIDRQILAQVLEAVERNRGTYEILDLTLGRTREDESRVALKIAAPNWAALERILRVLAPLGAVSPQVAPARLEPAPADGALPDHFYVTTNLPTEVYVAGRWLPVAEEEMDLALVVDDHDRQVHAVPMAEVRAGQRVVVGHAGVRVSYPPRGADEGYFRFMGSAVSAEKPPKPLLQRVVAAVRRVKAAGRKVLLVGGPAIIHTGAGPILAQLIRDGWVDVLFAGNALAVHDIESALFGTSLGVPLGDRPPGQEGHAHHLWAINSVRRAGSIAELVARGQLTRGVMHACLMRPIPFVLAGSIRDDGPLPEVITDVLSAQHAMRALVTDVGLAFLVGTTLHAIATGNLLSARVFTVCVDINPGVVTKLRDRGTRQSLGVVMDAASFLEQLAAGLKAAETP
jgi:lysine-ketoglutarate reductase/saccharopine dehydrogenase-like protein (TIGR00300 family)